jgi:biopolymer transport protein ExbD/biopolymer transport protein TolR
MAYKPQAGAVMAAPNVVPMADVMLVLLIIFMVITPMLQHGFSVDMAKVDNATDMPDADKDDAIIVAVSASGDVYLGSTKVDTGDLTTQVEDRLSNRTDKTVFVRSDARAHYGDVVAVVDAVRAAGVDHLGLLTDRTQPAQASAPPPPPSE